MADVKDNLTKQRNFGTRGLESTIPRPNILRIESLDANSRERYLGTVQKGADILKNKIYKGVADNKDTVFYGFMRNTADQTYGLSSDWEGSAAGGGVLGSAKAMVDKVGKAVPVVGLVTDLVQGSADLANDLTGINAKVTGSSSLKRYTHSGFSSPFKVECGWYLPEQFLLCLRSLRILHKMIYPIKADDKSIESELPAILKAQLESIAKAIEGGALGNTAANIFSTAANVAGSEAGKTAMKALIAGNRFFGRELTFDPLPVRVCVGQYMDLEPLVITNMNISFSKETYINKEGRHVPLTCTATIQFKFWMNPAPNLNFVSLFGHEMFGDTKQTSDSNKSLVNAYKVRN